MPEIAFLAQNERCVSSAAIYDDDACELFVLCMAAKFGRWLFTYFTTVFAYFSCLCDRFQPVFVD